MTKLPLNITLSKKRHLPVFECMGSTFALWDRAFLSARKEFDVLSPWPDAPIAGHISTWQKLGTKEKVTVRHVKTGWTLTMHLYYFNGMLKEWFMKRQWPQFYLPRGGVRGRTVLDVGAGEGETALFYLSNGAKKVVCVESWAPAAELLRQNARENSWPVEVIPNDFEPSMLDEPHDFLKMDCELCEASLLDYPSDVGPASIESHTPELTRSLCEKFGMREVYSSESGLSIVVKP
jgi:hypothetical protein